MDICDRDKCARSGKGSCPEPVGYRIRSSRPISGAVWPSPGKLELDVPHRCVAVAIAAKSRTDPGAAIQVIHLETGQVVYQKPVEPPWELFAAA